jgi:hypothetical protein
MTWGSPAKVSPYGKTSPAPEWVPASPEATAFAFGAMLQREYGNSWPRLIGIASQAAMNADHGIVDPCFSPADMG